MKLLFLKVPLAEKILFTKHLSMMVKSGMTEIESVKLLARQVKSKSFKTILAAVVTDLENGQFLSNALKPYENVFGNLFISIINLGEKSGTLAENLEFLSKDLQESKALRSKVRSALIYPSILLVATIGVISTLVFLILPKILPIFDSLKAELPAATRILIKVSTTLREDFLLISLTIVTAIAIWTILLRISKVRYFIHRILLILPFAGAISKKYNMANLTRSLGILLKSGVRIVEAITTASQMTDNLVYREALGKVAEEVRRGQELHEYLEETPDLFPPTVTRMIEVGEKTGNLEENLAYLSEFYKNEVDDTVANLSSVLEPALLLIMGGLVGFVAISIITPIYQITTAF